MTSIEHRLAGYGVTVTYTGQPDDETAGSVLVRDIFAIVTPFAGRLHGRRPAKSKRLQAAVGAEVRSDAA
jgi:putative resolvase